MYSRRAGAWNGWKGGEAHWFPKPCPQILLSWLWCSVLWGQGLLPRATWAGQVLGPKLVLKHFFVFLFLPTQNLGVIWWREAFLLFQFSIIKCAHLMLMLFILPTGIINIYFVELYKNIFLNFDFLKLLE